MSSNPTHGEAYVIQPYVIKLICQWLAAILWFSPGTPVSSTNKTDCHDITEILLKVALNSITPYRVRYWMHWDYNKILKLSPSREAIPLIRSLFHCKRGYLTTREGDYYTMNLVTMIYLPQKSQIAGKWKIKHFFNSIQQKINTMKKYIIKPVLRGHL